MIKGASSEDDSDSDISFSSFKTAVNEIDSNSLTYYTPFGSLRSETSFGVQRCESPIQESLRSLEEEVQSNFGSISPSNSNLSSKFEYPVDSLISPDYNMSSNLTEVDGNDLLPTKPEKDKKKKGLRLSFKKKKNKGMKSDNGLSGVDSDASTPSAPPTPRGTLDRKNIPSRALEPDLVKAEATPGDSSEQTHSETEALTPAKEKSGKKFGGSLNLLKGYKNKSKNQVPTSPILLATSTSPDDATHVDIDQIPERTNEPLLIKFANPILDLSKPQESESSPSKTTKEESQIPEFSSKTLEERKVVGDVKSVITEESSKNEEKSPIKEKESETQDLIEQTEIKIKSSKPLKTFKVLGAIKSDFNDEHKRKSSKKKSLPQEMEENEARMGITPNEVKTPQKEVTRESENAILVTTKLISSSLVSCDEINPNETPFSFPSLSSDILSPETKSLNIESSKTNLLPPKNNFGSTQSLERNPSPKAHFSSSWDNSYISNSYASKSPKPLSPDCYAPFGGTKQSYSPPKIQKTSNQVIDDPETGDDSAPKSTLIPTTLNDSNDEKMKSVDEDGYGLSFAELSPHLSDSWAVSSLDKSEHLYKILVIGELGTGKTSIIKRYVHQFYCQHYRATIGVDFALKLLHWDDNTLVRLQLWDIAGQERFGNMTRVYYKQAVAAFIVFDVTNTKTFDAVTKWKTDLDNKVALPDGSPIPAVLLANKCDQPKEGVVCSTEEMDNYCKEKNFAGWFETSAKENINIEEATKFLVTKILSNEKSGLMLYGSSDSDRLSLDCTEQLNNKANDGCLC